MEVQLNAALTASESQRMEEHRLHETIVTQRQQLSNFETYLEEARTGCVSHPEKQTLRQQLTNAEIQLKGFETRAQQLHITLK